MWCEKNLALFFVFSYIFVSILAYNDNKFVCDYYLADSKGFVVNKVVFERRLGWSLHGAWNVNGSYQGPCLTPEEFRSKWNGYLAQGKLVHFVDNSPVTHHTCCVSQWHEYEKHGCKKKVRYEDWEFAIFDCMRKFKPKDLYVHRCRYDYELGCNFVDEVSTEALVLVNCKQGKPFCSDICFHENGNSVCKVNHDQHRRSYWYSLKFKIPEYWYPQPYEDQPNCYCGMHPDESARFHEVERLDSFGIYEQVARQEDDYFHNNSQTEVDYDFITSITTTQKPTVVKDEDETSMSDSIPCTCLPKDVGEREVEVTSDTDWLQFLRVPRVAGYLIEAAAQKYRVWCKNNRGRLVLVTPPSQGNARLSEVEARKMDEWERVAEANRQKLRLMRNRNAEQKI